MKSGYKTIALAITIFTTLVALPAGQVHAEEAWWQDSLKTAERDGYQVVNQQGLEQTLAADPPPLLLDVRPDYEFESGHIPGAANLEFDLGDKLQLDPEKKTKFQTLAGADTKRPVIIYCRSLS